MAARIPGKADSLPELTKDRSFWAMTVTQFLGAFNDNLFKQLVLLFCVDLALRDRSHNLQGVATVVFSAPFILFSGFGGFLSDRNSKKSIVVLCKVAEILVMFLGVIAFKLGSLSVLMAVLFLMGSQSAFFGPAKYGILPEMVRERDLPRANGIILMTTFLAIIFGFAIAGYIKEVFQENLWMACLTCIAIAALGTATSLLIRQTPVAQPGLKFDPSALLVNRYTVRLLLRDRELLLVLVVYSMFWFIAGVIYPPAINDLGKLQLRVGDSLTGQLAACTGVGIAIGCVAAGRLSRGRVRADLIRWGLWGMFGCLVLLAWPSAQPKATWLSQAGAAVGGWLTDLPGLGRVAQRVHPSLWGPGAALIAMGTFAGAFSVPMQVFLQAQAPEEQKGRIIGAMNLVNWIGIALSGVFYSFANLVLTRLDVPPNGMFGAAALLLLPVALLYRPRDLEL